MLVFAALLAFSPAMAHTTAPSAPPPIPQPRKPMVRPTFANLAYAPAATPSSRGHLLDLYIPPAKAPLPLVIWTGGSAWLSDNGKDSAGWLVPELTKAGYAVAGVSIRSSSEVKFPGQLHDIKAAIRYLRANAVSYGLDPARIAIMGDSSGGWTAAMAALTGDDLGLEGDVGTTGVSSAVQAAIAFYPPTRFTIMDRWAAVPCKPGGFAPGVPHFCHNSEDSPESRLIGCQIQECSDRAALADPARYVDEKSPPIMILHGESDPLVPHSQGEWLYQALNKACRDAIFISLPRAGHGPARAFLTDKNLMEGATIRSTSAEGCRVKPPDLYKPGWYTVIGFLDGVLKAKAAMRPEGKPEAKLDARPTGGTRMR